MNTRPTVQDTSPISGSHGPAMDTPGEAPNRLRASTLGSVTALFASTAVLLYQEQPAPLTIAALAVSALGLWWSVGWRRRAWITALTLDLGLLVVYSWSLGQSIHVTVRATRAGYLADVGGNSFFQPARRTREPGAGVGAIGLFAGAASRYVVGPAGKPAPSITLSPLTWLATLSRFAVPRPAWSSVQLTARSHAKSFSAAQIRATSGSWSANPRGEIEGTLGAAGLLGQPGSRRFTFSADLMRGDGIQGMLLGIGPKGYGYLLAVRLDHRDARFYYWNNGVIGICTCARPITFPVATIPMIQRALQFSLPSVILALFLALLAVAAYAVFVPLAIGPSKWIAGLSGKRFVIANPPWPWALDAAAIVVGAAGIVSGALIALNVNLTLPTIEDTATYLFQAKTFALGRLWAPIPRDFSFFSLPFTVAVHGHWFGKYPPGWPLLLSIGTLFGKPWMVTPVVGGLTLMLIYLIAREIYDRPVGLLASALALSSPFVLSMSGSLLAQSATWFFLGLFVYLLVLWVKRSGRWEGFSFRISREHSLYLAGAGLALGMAIMTRQLDALTVAFPFLILLARRPLNSLWLALGCALPGLLFLVYNETVTGTVLGNGYTRAQPWDKLGFGPGVGGPYPYDAGFTFARGVWNISYDLEHLQGSLFGWPFFFALAFVALPFLLGRATGWDWLLASSCATVVGAYTFYWASGVTGGLPRYWYVIVPWLALLAARGLQELYWLPLRSLPQLPRLGPVALALPVVLLAALTAYDVVFYLPSNVLDFRNVYGPAIAAVHRAGIHNAIVFQVQHTAQQGEFDAAFAQNSPLLTGDILWAKDEGARDILVMRRYPGRRYYRLSYTSLVRLQPPG